MTDLAHTLDLLQRRHRQNSPVLSRGGGPTSAEYHSLWPRIAEIREQAAASDAECIAWLAQHHNLITAVEACQQVARVGAVTYRGPSR